MHCWEYRRKAGTQRKLPSSYVWDRWPQLWIMLQRDIQTKRSWQSRNRRVSNNVKILVNQVELVKGLVFPISLCLAETWTMRKTGRKKIEAFKKWSLWQMVIVSCVSPLIGHDSMAQGDNKNPDMFKLYGALHLQIVSCWRTNAHWCC